MQACREAHFWTPPFWVSTYCPAAGQAPFGRIWGWIGKDMGRIGDHQGAGIRTEGFRSEPISAPKGIGRVPNTNSSGSFGPLPLCFPAPLNYPGAGLRTESSRSKPTSAPKG